jgi:predicted nuclease with TOPRIM domain
VLAEIGLDAEAPAHTLAQALDEMAGRVQRLAVIVGRDLEACDLDRQRENLQAIRAENRGSLLVLQERLDEASQLRRAVEQRLLEAEVATSQAALSVAEANAARETAVQERQHAELALQTSTARADEAAARASLAVAAAVIWSALSGQ